MKKMTANEIRNSWIEFFKRKGHYFLEPASLIPINDPSLLWINSGVATLKNYFSGKENPPSNRLVNSQKALRTNDFFNVGVTSRHNTFFEMLGNFSIGDYFKKEAVEFAFELLTKEWDIEVEKLWITVFEDDEETYNLWIKLGIIPNQILKCGRDRNFWDVGNGPCGPCTEIHYDRGTKYDPNNIGEKLIREDIENDRYIEIWNIVFSQFNNDGQNNYTELLRKNIDTGSGLERIASISQDVPTNFDTDLFQNIIKKVESFTPHKYDTNAYFSNDEKQIKINFNYKVIADHFRASIFAIADGVIPDSKDRGYILRRLIRRAIVFAHNLEINDNSWISAAIDGVIDTFKDFYPYLLQERNKIITILEREANLFNKTLKQGMKLFNEAVQKNNLDDELVFQLVTTYGFPIELIKELCNYKNIAINEEEFKKRFAEHQKISNANNNIKALDNQNNNLMNLKVVSKFLYDLTTHKAKVIKLYDEQFNEVDELNYANGYVVLDETIFYATSGGQLHDTGTINDTIFVDDVTKGPNLQHIHHVINANLKLNDEVALKINENDRRKNMAHHSSEHLLQSALKKFISSNVKQQGAFKSPQKLTFDFQHHEKVGDDVLEQIENWINDVIKSKIDVQVLMMTLEEAQQNNAAAYFEDMYKRISGLLRVIKIGDKSIELCGGTHVNNTGDIEQFAIIDYFSKGSGQWRVEGVSTFENIENYKKDFKIKLEELYLNTKNNFVSQNMPTEALDKIYNDILVKMSNIKLRHYVQILNSFKTEIQELKTNIANQQSKEQVSKIKTMYNNIDSNKKVLLFENDNVDANNISKALTDLVNEASTAIYAAVIVQNGKVQYILMCNKNNTELDLNNLIQEINKISDGKGSGKPFFARGGSANVDSKNNIIKFLTDNGFKNA